MAPFLYQQNNTSGSNQIAARLYLLFHNFFSLLKTYYWYLSCHCKMSIPFGFPNALSTHGFATTASFSFSQNILVCGSKWTPGSIKMASNVFRYALQTATFVFFWAACLLVSINISLSTWHLRTIQIFHAVVYLQIYPQYHFLFFYILMKCYQEANKVYLWYGSFSFIWFLRSFWSSLLLKKINTYDSLLSFDEKVTSY